MPTPPYPLHPQPMNKSWLERNPRWKIPLGALILLLLMAIGGIPGLMTVLSIRDSDVVQQCLARAAANPQIHDDIGDPIQAGWFVPGEYKAGDKTGEAKLWIPVSGPKGKAKIHVVAAKSAGVWRFYSMKANVEGEAAEIDLLAPPESPE